MVIIHAVKNLMPVWSCIPPSVDLLRASRQSGSLFARSQWHSLVLSLPEQHSAIVKRHRECQKSFRVRVRACSQDKNTNKTAVVGEDGEPKRKWHDRTSGVQFYKTVSTGKVTNHPAASATVEPLIVPRQLRQNQMSFLTAFPLPETRCGLLRTSFITLPMWQPPSVTRVSETN